MRAIKSLLLFAFVLLSVLYANGQQSNKFSCKGYTYLSPSEGFYKIHTIPLTWAEAKNRCTLEGASLFYPVNEKEANTVLGLWNQTQPIPWVYIGISDLRIKFFFETIDGRPILNVYNKWGPGEPNNVGGVEDCVLLRLDGTLVDYSCNNKVPFICKKALVDLESDNDCNMPRTDGQKSKKFSCKDYTYLSPSEGFYKIYTIPLTWAEAKNRCTLEGASLFYPVNEKEANTVLGFWNQTQSIPWVYIGISDLRIKFFFETIDGRPMLNVYNKWGPGEPNNVGGVEDCVLLRLDGTLVDYSCNNKVPFICKKALVNLESDNDCNMPKTAQGVGGVLPGAVVTETQHAPQPDQAQHIDPAQGVGGVLPGASVAETQPLDPRPDQAQHVDPDSQQIRKFFRKDYTYLSPSEGFYKIHTIQRTWAEAKKRCALEGASLFYPGNEKEANTVLGFWNQTQPFPFVYIGISDLLAKGVFETIDSRPILDVYSIWGPGEPDDMGGVEDCVLLRRDGTLADYPCNNKAPFICKKALVDLDWHNDCNMPRTGYTYNVDLGSCYKFHTNPKNWADALSICSAEQSYLAIINSKAEADYLVQLTEKTNKDNAPGITMYGAVFLGFHNRYGDGWTTVKGTSLQDSGYVKWSPNRPYGGVNEQCGSMFYNGQLNDVACDQRCFFICEHDTST